MYPSPTARAAVSCTPISTTRGNWRSRPPSSRMHSGESAVCRWARRWPSPASPEHGYRMRARLHVRGGRWGFFREGTHTTLRCEGDPTAAPRDLRRRRRDGVAVGCVRRSVHRGQRNRDLRERGRVRARHVLRDGRRPIHRRRSVLCPGGGAALRDRPSRDTGAARGTDAACARVLSRATVICSIGWSRTWWAHWSPAHQPSTSTRGSASSRSARPSARGSASRPSRATGSRLRTCARMPIVAPPAGCAPSTKRSRRSRHERRSARMW